MSDPKPERLFAVVSPREARLLFWLILIALLAIIANLSAGVVETLSGPAVILFVAWLMAYVLEPFVDWLAHHMPFKSRGLSVAVTYVSTIVIAFVVLLAAGVTLIQAAISFAENLPAIVAHVRELLTPMAESLGLSAPANVDLPTIISEFVARNGQAIADAAKNATANMIALVAGLFTAVIISVGLAAGQVTLFGWLRRFLPERTYVDLAALERAIAISFGGFVRGRGLIGLIYGGDGPRGRAHLPGPVRAADRGHRGADRLHPVDRTAHRLGRAPGLRRGIRARGGRAVPDPEPDRGRSGSS